MAVTWNPADTSASVLFSNGNLTLTVASGSFQSTRATLNFASPLKLYMEHVVTVSLADILLGLGSNTAGLTGQFTGQGITSVGYQPSSGQVLQNSAVLATLATAALTNTICQAWDIAASKIWIRVNGGNWNNNPAADPATGAGAVVMGGGIGGGPFPMATGGGGTVLTSNFGAAAFGFAVPAGFGSPNNPVVPGAASGFFLGAI